MPPADKRKITVLMKLIKIQPMPIISIVLVSLLPLTTNALTLAEKDLQVAQEVDQRDSGFVDLATKVTMVLKDKSGRENKRELRIKTLEMESDGDKTLTIFDSPKDQKGVALLSHSHKVKDDDQWLYLPSICRVKRIVAQNRSGPFVGSEFAYEDINTPEIERFTYKYLGEEPCGEVTCIKYERFPIDRFSGYSKNVIWVQKNEMRYAKIDYYDRKESLLKSLNFFNYKRYLDRFWRPDYIEMVNHQTGNSTRLLFRDREFGVGLNESDFSENQLKRVK